MTAMEFLAALEKDKLERLKWLVLREFGVLPGSEAARQLSDEDYLRCGAHLLLDLRQSRDRTNDEEAKNSAFDAGRFLELSEER